MNNKLFSINMNFQPLLCKFGKHKTLYAHIKYEWGSIGPTRDECIYCGKEYVWIYLGREDNMYNKCEVLDDE